MGLAYLVRNRHSTTIEVKAERQNVKPAAKAMRHTILATTLGILVLGLSACGSPDRPTARSPVQDSGETPALPQARCSDYQEGFKNSYFGDLHTHTSYSLDSYFFNALTDPRKSHRFAKGISPLPFPKKGSQDPFTADFEVSIDRPLDFNAITDHAEFLGGFTTACDTTPQTQQECDARIGQGIRDNIRSIAAGDIPFQTQLLQSLIAQSPSSVATWQETKTVNDEEYEPCSYTTFHGYEYTSNELSQMFHRNVIFKGSANETPNTVFPAVGPTTATNPENGNDDWDLFDHLQSNCKNLGNCDVLTIPHNSNRSDGRMFLASDETSGMTVNGGLNGAPLGRKVPQSDVYFPMTEADAELRRSIDRNYEITQHKGQSECAIGLEGSYLANDEGYDPGCDFEVDNSVCRGLPDDPASCAHFCTGSPADPSFCGFSDFGNNLVPLCEFAGPDGSSRPASGGDNTGNCRSPLDMYRNAMAEGLKIKQALGINPYRINITASLDTHAGDSGLAQETPFLGHGGIIDDDPREMLGFWGCDNEADGEDPADLNNCTNRTFVDFARPLTPGGLAGVWASENTRNDIWDAIHSGETWGTSGTRMRVRSIASWQPLPDNICERLASGEDLTSSGAIAEAAQMGATMPANTTNDGPYIAIWAEQDPDGIPLQQIDLIKGYINADNDPKVLALNSISRTDSNVAPPRFNDCAVAVDNHPETLCAIWHDDDFDASKDAYYYPRVRELPSCRWSTHTCRQAQSDCSLLDSSNGMYPESTGLSGYEGCCQIEENNGVFSGQDRFATIEERAWGSPIWYETTP